jgi:heat shock protein HslJ
MVRSRDVRAGLVAGCLAVALAGCAGDAGDGRTVSGPADLLGDGVVLESGVVDGTPLGLPDDVRVTLLPGGGGTEDPEAVSGVSGCNHYGATMTLDGDEVTVTGAGGTDMACEPELMALESTYLAALPRVRTGGWDDDRLTLVGDGVELVFTAAEAVPTQALLGTTWRLESLLDGETASSTVAGAEPATLELREDGTLAGSTGCRALTGRYEVVADEVLLTDLAADGECPAELAPQDAHVVEVLGDGFTVVVDGGSLAASSSRGGLGLVYRAP